jgi:hypothetical protein
MSQTTPSRENDNCTVPLIACARCRSMIMLPNRRCTAAETAGPFLSIQRKSTLSPQRRSEWRRQFAKRSLRRHRERHAGHGASLGELVDLQLHGAADEPLANRCCATIESLDHGVGERCLAQWKSVLSYHGSCRTGGRATTDAPESPGRAWRNARGCCGAQGQGEEKRRADAALLLRASYSSSSW